MAAIPGLGQIPAQPAASATRTISLRPFWEWRFQVSFTADPVKVRLLSGTAEKDGTELALQHIYNFCGIKSKINTWYGCELEVTGSCERESVAEHALATDTPLSSYLNLHLALSNLRSCSFQNAQSQSQQTIHSPRVLIAGGPATGKSTLARSLAAWATRMRGQPCVVNTNTREGMLALPGTLSAAVFATLMDIESCGGGWGSTPTSGPSAVPVKLPLVFFYGSAAPEDDVEGYKQAISRIAGPVSARLSADADVKRSGLIVDTPAFAGDHQTDAELLAHIVEELSVNIVVVLGTPALFQGLQKKLSSTTTSLGEPIAIVDLDKSKGVVERDEDFLQQCREAVIKEYFFGEASRPLSPSTQSVDADSLVIYRIPDDSIYDDESQAPLVKVQVVEEMEHWALAIMAATLRDSPETVKAAVVTGFVYIAQVDMERRRVKILTPITGRFDRPLIWGKWPEPFFNLLG